jgi:predicted Zn-dependent peptidase
MQEFTETTLPNGIKLCHFAADFPVSSFEILLPLGSAHAGVSGGSIPDGAPHFLEHLQMLRSDLFPEKGSLEKIIGLEGGYDNAHTYNEWTSYELTVPADAVSVTFPGLCDRVFRPFFKEIDFENQCNIIANEREHRRRFFPGSTPSGHYYNTEFMKDLPVSLERIFGSDETMATFTPELMEKIHREAAEAEGVTVYSAGSHSIALIEEVLSALPPRRHYQPPVHMDPVIWVDPEYREKAFDNINQPSLDVAWIKPKGTFKERMGIGFLLQLFFNTVHGHVYHMLRHERGWIYDLDWYFSERATEQLFGISFPLMDVKTIQQLRSELFVWMNEAVHDQEAVEREIHRRFRRQVTWYETAQGSVEMEADLFRTEGRQVPYQEWRAAIESMEDLAYREDIFKRMLNKESYGEIAFLPVD